MEQKIEDILSRHPRDNRLRLIAILEEMSRSNIKLSIPNGILISRHTGINVSEVYSLCKTAFNQIIEKSKMADLEVCCGSNCYLSSGRKSLQKLQLPSNSMTQLSDTGLGVKLSIRKCNGKCWSAKPIAVNPAAADAEMLQSIISRETSHA